MTDDLQLRRKWTFRLPGEVHRQLVFSKKAWESNEHVFLKAFLWALYVDEYPDLLIERSIGDRYKPDVFAADAAGQPAFWGEAGQTRAAKVESILKRFAGLHFVIAKWNHQMPLLIQQYERAVAKSRGLRRGARVEILNFPDDSAERFIQADGTIQIARDDLEVYQFTPE